MPHRLKAALDRIGGLYPRAIDLSLERLRALMTRLGNPEMRLPPVIHVAGTNGKGSTVAALRAIAETAGLRVHCYTSPHLVRFNERIRLAGNLITDEALLDLIETVERVDDGAPITFFEITTAVAFLGFSRVPADLVLLETGLGGRLDATNLIDRPAATIITPIGLDHMNWLGETLTEIAREKAGILKPHCPAVLADQVPAAAVVLEAQARALAAPLRRAGREWWAEPEGDGWRFTGRRLEVDLPLPSLPGLHQIANAGAAIAALEAMDGIELSQPVLAEAMARIEWPARLQRLTRGPLVGLAGPDHELWLDGAHNAHAGAMLARHAASFWGDRDLHVIFGGLDNRDPAAVLGALAPMIASLHGVAIPGAPNSHSAEAVRQAGRSIGIDAFASSSIADAIRAIVAERSVPARLLICGSLYLAGHVLAENG